MAEPPAPLPDGDEQAPVQIRIARPDSRAGLKPERRDIAYPPIPDRDHFDLRRRRIRTRAYPEAPPQANAHRYWSGNPALVEHGQLVLGEGAMVEREVSGS
jgi:hypothetical protein